MDYKQLSKNSYLDILFFNRNKGYGSYQLRIAYNNNAYKAIGAFAILLIMSLAAAKWLQKTELPNYEIAKEVEKLKEIFVDNSKKVEIIPEEIKESLNTKSSTAAGLKTVQQTANTAIVSNQTVIDPREQIKDVPDDAHAGNEEFDTDNKHGKVGGKGDENDGLDKDDKKGDGDDDIVIDDKAIHQLVDEKAKASYDVIAFIKKHLQYPELARANEIEGTLQITFVVEKDGSISNVKLANKDIGGGCSQAAIDVVKKFPKWQAATKNKVTVRSFMKVPINFKLNR